MVEELGPYVSAILDGYDLPSEAGVIQNLFLQDMPDDPDNVAVMYQYGGQRPRETMGRPLLSEMPRLQVIVRHEFVETAFADAYKFMEILQAVKQQTIGGTVYRRIYAVSSPSELGPDSKNRQRVVCNYQVDKDYS